MKRPKESSGNVGVSPDIVRSRPTSKNLPKPVGNQTKTSLPSYTARIDTRYCGFNRTEGRPTLQSVGKGSVEIAHSFGQLLVPVYTV